MAENKKVVSMRFEGSLMGVNGLELKLKDMETKRIHSVVIGELPEGVMNDLLARGSYEVLKDLIAKEKDTSFEGKIAAMGRKIESLRSGEKRLSGDGAATRKANAERIKQEMQEKDNTIAELKAAMEELRRMMAEQGKPKAGKVK